MFIILIFISFSFIIIIYLYYLFFFSKFKLIIKKALNYIGLVTVHWDVLEKKLIGALDQDDDGKLTQKDANIATARYIHLLTQDLPFAGGFAASFALGMKYG